MNYYNEIKNELINNEIYKKAKDYSKNRNDLSTYYNVGKLLADAGKHYGENIIKEYSKMLTVELKKTYNERTLRKMRQFYKLFANEKWSPPAAKLSWSHYQELLSIKDIDKIKYYIYLCTNNNLSKRELREKIKNKEYERLDNNTKLKLINNDETKIEDFIKNPIIIKNRFATTDISEKMLKQLILEDITSFMHELGNGYSYIDNEYKIRIGNSYNYIDLLLFNFEYNCFVVIELKTTELRKEYIGQIETYMHYIDKNIKSINHDKTIGIIISRRDNRFIMEYASDDRIFSKEFVLN